MAGPRKQAETAFVPTLDKRLDKAFGDSNESVRVPDDAVFRDLESCLDPRRRWYWYIELAGLRWLDDESVPWNARCRTAILRARSRFESGTIHSAFSDLRTAISLAVSNGKSVEETKLVFQASVIVFETAVTSAFDANDIENCIRLGAEWLHLESEFPCLVIEISDTALNAIATSEKESGSTCAITSILSITKGLFGLCRTVIRFARSASSGKEETSSLMAELIRKADGVSQYETIADKINTEIAAHIRSEESEAKAKRTGQILQAWKTTVDRHREKIKKLCRIWPLHSRWKDPIQTFSRMVDRLDFPETWREDIHSCLDKWNTTLIEKDKVSVALDAMERELAVLPKSSGRTMTDEKGYKLDFPKVEGMSVCSEVEAQAKARYIVLADSAKWEVSKPIIEDIPDPKVDLRDFAKGTEYKRQSLKRVLSEASRPVAFLFRNVKYWVIAGGTVFLAFWWISPLGRLAYGPEDAFWRPMFWMFFIFFGPLLAYNWRWHREEIARLRLSAETYGRSFDSSLSALRASESCDEEMKNRLSVLLERKREVDSKTIECVEIIRKTQGFRDLTWFSDAQERSDKAKRDFAAAWTCLLVAVKREVELLHRIEEWSKRGESLGAKRNKAFEALQTAVHKTCEQISAKRRELKASAREAEKNIGTCLDKLSDRAEAPDSETEALQATADSAALEADEARRVWEAAKAATDEAISRAEEEEKRRVEERLQFSRLKDRTIPEIRKRLEAVREVSVVMPEIAARRGSLEDDLSVWDGKNAPAGGNLEEENSFAAQLMERANALAEDGRKAVELVDITKRARERVGEAHVDNDTPPFATAEMATVRIVFEIVARQTDWKKSEKAACILKKAEERKRRLDALVCEWRQLAPRLEEIGRLEERTEVAWVGLLWRNPSFAPHLDQMAIPVQSSGQFTDALLRIADYTNALNLSLEQLNEERTRQLDSFQAAATERLGESRAILCLHHFEPRPADLFERTRQGSFEDRCCWILDWYELLFSLYGERQRNAMEGGGGSSLPARAFLRLCEIAGTSSVKDETVRDLVAKSRDWDALSRQIEEMMPVDEGQNDDGHRRMFEQARTAIHELTELCDDCPVQSVEVRCAFQRLCEASEWIRNNRLPRERTLSARQKIETDFQSLEALDMPIDSEERDQLLGRGDTLLQQSDFQGSRDAFESCHASLAERIRQLSPRLVLRIAMPEEGRTRTTTFSIVSPQGNKIHFDVNEARNQECDKLEPEVVYKTPDFRCYVAGRTSVGTFSNSVDVGLVDWHGIREMDVSLWADRFSFPLSGTVAPLEFRRAPNGLWYCVQAMTMDQFTALVNTEQRRTDNPRGRSKGGRSKVCAGMTWVSANRFAEKVTQKALAEGFRLPDGTTPTFRLPSPEEWEQGSELGTKTFSSVGPAFHEWCTRMDERYAYHCRIIGPSVIRSVERDWDCINDSFPFGRVVDPVGFRLVCDPRP